MTPKWVMLNCSDLARRGRRTGLALALGLAKGLGLSSVMLAAGVAQPLQVAAAPAAAVAARAASVERLDAANAAALAAACLALSPGPVPAVGPAAPSATAALVGATAAGESLLFTVPDLDWLDVRRGRAVPVRLYLPVAASTLKPMPFIVFSHGIGGSRNGYSYLGRFWAGQGYASLHLQHVGSDRALWSGNPFVVVGRLQAAAQDSEATARVQDLSFALDQVLAGEFAARLDAGRVVAAGHSYGANTTLMAVGAQVQRGGRLIDLRDPRIKAATQALSLAFLKSVFDGDSLGLRDWTVQFASLLARSKIDRR